MIIELTSNMTKRSRILLGILDFHSKIKSSLPSGDPFF